MDKKGIIDEILSEWAMQCEDGMVGGHLTEDNISALTSVLEKRGFTKDEVLEVITPMVDKMAETREKERRAAQDKAEWERIENKTKERKAQQQKNPNFISPEILDVKIKQKEYKPTGLGKMLKLILMNQSSDKKKSLGLDQKDLDEFISRFDSSNDIKDAVEKYKTTPQELKNRINSISTGQKRSGIGRGEMLLVWFIKGATHGGTATGDIVLGNSTVDVKELSGDSLSVEMASFDNFTGIPFVTDVLDISSKLKGESEKNYARNMLKRFDDELKQYVSERKRGSITISSVKESTEFFINTPSIVNLNATTLIGWNFIVKKIKESVKPGAPSTTIISVYQDGKKHSAKIDDMDFFSNQPIQNAIDNVPDDGKEIAIKAKPIDNNDETISRSVFLRSTYFKNNWDETNIWPNVAQYLKYDGIIFLKEGANDILDYVSKEEFATKLGLVAFGSKSLTLKYKPASQE